MTPRQRQSDRNPFEYGRELDREELVDRTAELDQLVRSIQNQDRLFLIGPRRHGKTSLLGAAATVVRADGTLVLRYDAERYETLDLLAQALLSAATRQMATTVERAGALLKRWAGTLKPEVSYSVEEQAIKVSIGAAGTTEGAGALPILVDVLDAIDRLAAETGRSATVVIDEFQQVIALGGPTAERQIRAAVQQHRHVGYIFAGSATRMLADMTGDPGRAFYKLGQRLMLGPIPRPDFLTFLQDGFESAGFVAEAAALVAILDRAEDVPYTVQRLAHECWEMLRVAKAGGLATAPPILTELLVDAALERVLRQEDAAYTQIWNSLTLQQKRALKAVILERGRTLQSADVTQRYRVPASSMQRALQSLDARGLVRESGSQGSIEHRLEDPLLGHWLRWAQQLGPI